MALTIEWIRDGVGFAPDAAAAFQRAEAQVRAEFGRDIDVNSTFRSWDDQLAMHAASLAFLSGAGPYPGHSYATHPQYSRHVSGVAVDSDDWVTPRIRDILAENGFIRNQLHVPNEEHHFEWIRESDQHFGQPLAGGRRPFQEETGMPRRINNQTKGDAYVVGDGWIRHMIDVETARANQAAYGPAVKLDDAAFRRVTRSLGCPDVDIPKNGRMWVRPSQVTAAQVRRIARAVTAKLGADPVEMDFEEVADTVNDESDILIRNQIE